MIRRSVTRGIAVIGAVLVGAAMSFVALPASAAGVDTGLTFETAGPIEVSFGEEWLIVLNAEVRYEGGPNLPLGPGDGTVDVYFSGIGGAFATSLAIQADGRVYVSQSSTAPLLGAGSYEVSAIYNPVPGGFYASSQTGSPFSLTVTPLEVAPRVQVGIDSAVSERPIITANVSGSYLDSTGGAPAGTWKFDVTGPSGDVVFESERAQLQGGTDSVRVEIIAKLDKGERYTVNSTFVPVAELAGGLTVSAISPIDFNTPAGGLGDTIGAAVPTPLWLALLLLALVLALATAAIVLGVKLRGRAGPTPDATGAESERRIPGDPTNVEVVSPEQMGLPEPATIPELGGDTGATRKLPTSTTWLLSDVEPATSLPDFADAPTERIDAVVSPADDSTELIDTSETPAGDGKADS